MPFGLPPGMALPRPPGLCRLDDPIPSNEGPDWYLVPAILRFGVAKRPYKGSWVELSLLSAYLAVLETSYQIAWWRGD
jgi:hypothetical protein